MLAGCEALCCVCGSGCCTTAFSLHCTRRSRWLVGCTFVDSPAFAHLWPVMSSSHTLLYSPGLCRPGGMVDTTGLSPLRPCKRHTGPHSRPAATCSTRLRAVSGGYAKRLWQISHSPNKTLCTACWERVFAVSASCGALVWPACLTASCRSATLPAADGAPFHWGASERFLADCMRGEGGQAAGSSRPRPVVVSKYIPLPWRVFEPRCMLAALRSSGGLVAVRACQHSGRCRIVAANAGAQRAGRGSRLSASAAPLAPLPCSGQAWGG